ncbi:MAG TPA: hypothetical protein H9675_04785 [Firmicutes bacterium]|nr:hypothetical protein [Bacillota bacterium]
MVFDEMDRDMKIAGSRPSREMQPEEDIEEIADNLFTEKESGVLAKAHDLGRELVSLLFDSDDFAYDDNDADAYNKRILLSFSAISSIEDNVRNENVSNVALNSFLEAVKQEDERLYNDICSAGELSFYYLALKRGKEKERAIGNVFAMICGKEDNKEYIEKGASIYAGFAEETVKRIKKYQI